MRKSGKRSRAKKMRRSTVGFAGLEALETRALLDGSPFVTGVITPTGGSPTVIAGPGGLDGAPQLDLNDDSFGDYIVKYNVGGNINGPAAIDVTAILSDGVSPDTGARRWKEYRIGHYINSDTVASVTLGDLNNDGRTDVAIQWTDTSSASSARNIDLYLGRENGTFSSGQTISLGVINNGVNLSIFDANGDGMNDLVQQTIGKFTVYKGNGDGTVANPGVVTQIPITLSNALDLSQDLTGDGIRDIAISGSSNDGFASAFIGVYKGSAAGTYSSTDFPIPAGFGSLTTLKLLSLENLDADSALDIIALGSPSLLPGSPATLFAFRNDGAGTFTQSFSSGSLANGLYTPLNTDASSLLPFVVGDIDDDGDTDLAVMEGNLLSNDITIRIERNDGNAGFSESQSISITAFPNTSRILLIDMDNDGLDDLVVNHDKTTGGKVTTVYFSQGDGTFDAGLDIDHGLNSASNARIADFDDDGKQDLQFVTYADGLSGYSLTVMLNDGKTFAEPVTTNLGNVTVPQEGGGAPSNFPIFPVRDYDDDGLPDIIGNSSGGDPELGLVVIHAVGDGSFTYLAPTLIYNVNGNATGAAIVADFNLDGKPDLLLGTNGTGSIGVTTVINGDPLPPDSAGTDHNTPRLLGPLSTRATVIEHVSADANGNPRDRFDWFNYSVDAAVTVRSAVIPLVAPVIVHTSQANGIGGKGDYPTGLEPVFIDEQLTPGDRDTWIDKGSNSETDYRLDIFIPAAGPDIGVYQGLDQRASNEDPIDFGSLPKHTTDTRRTFLVRNDGLTTLNLSAVQFPDGFSFDTNNLVTSLAPGAYDYFTIRLNTGTPGTYGGDIVIPSDDADTPDFIIPVTAIVTDPGPNPLPLLAVLQGANALTSGQSLTFGSTAQGASLPLQKTFTIRNDGIANLTITSLQVPSGFVITEPLSPTTITPGKSDNFTVTVGTATAGNYFGDITFNHNSGDVAGTFILSVNALITGAGVTPLPNLTGEIQDILFKGASITNTTTLLPSDKVTAKLRVFNAAPGAVPSGNSTITFYASSDFAIDGNDTELQGFTIKNPRPIPGSYVDLKFDVTLPPTLASGNFRLLAKLDSSNAIEETSNNDNTAPSGKVMHVTLQAGQIDGRKNAKLTLQQPDNTLVTFALSSAGLADISRNEETGAYDVVITGGTAKTVLTVTTKGGGNATLLGDVTAADTSFAPLVTPILGKIIAKTATLVGDINVNGGLQALTLKGINNGSVFIGSATGAPKQTATLALGSVHNADVISHTPIKSLTAIEWIDDDEDHDKLEAASIGTLSVSGAKKPVPLAGDFEADIRGTNGNNAPLTSAKIAGSVSGAAWKLAGTGTSISVKGDLGAADGPVSIEAPAVKNISVGGNAKLVSLDLTQTFDPTKPKRQSLPKLVIKGTVDGLDIDSGDGVGMIQTGAMANSRIFVGMDDDATQLPGDQNAFLSDPGPGITSLVVANGFASSFIAARNIGAVTLPAITTANNADPFGIATTALKTLKIAGVKQPDADKNGSVDPINNPDFVLRIL